MVIKRSLNLDLLRIFAACMIVLLHVSAVDWYRLSPTSFNWQILNFYDCLVRAGVPIFFMISGSLFLSKEIDLKKLLKHNIKRLFVVYIIWLALYAIDTVGVQTLFSLTGMKAVISNMIQGGKYHLWFLPSLLAIYLITPILSCIVKYENGKYLKYAILLFLIFSVFKQTLLLIPMESNAIANIFDRVPYPLTGYCGYFLIGYYLSTIDTRKLKIKYLAILFIIVVLISAKICEVDAIAKGTANGLLYSYFSLPVFLEAVILFIIFKNIKLPKQVEVKSTTFSKISSYTLGVYVLHPFVIDKIINWLEFYPTKYNAVISVPVFSIMVLVFTLLIILVLKRIPFINKWLV